MEGRKEEKDEEIKGEVIWPVSKRSGEKSPSVRTGAVLENCVSEGKHK